MRSRASSVALVAGALAVGCSSSSSSASGHDGGQTSKTPDAGHADSGKADTGSVVHDAGRADAQPDAGAGETGAADSGAGDAGPGDVSLPPCTSGCSASAIEHLVLIVQENHTFDNYFGAYCTAAPGSNPTCTTGPACCEAAPATDPSGASPVLLNDSSNGLYNPNHQQACELSEIDNGKMDMYVTGTSCSGPGNFAIANFSSVGPYWTYATEGSIADRYFQPIVGASSSNDMYLARANFVFVDNSYEPSAKGASCVGGTQMDFTGPTIADLLVGAGVTFGVYAGGYASALAAAPGCGPVPAACPAGFAIYPCEYDPSDIPFEYYSTLSDNPLYMKDISAFATDIAAEKLPAFSYVKAIGYLTEHPGVRDTISGGISFVQSIESAVASSPYAKNTLVLVTWDESGGYFDHVAPPAASTIDNQPYGPRIPLMALGTFAKANTVSHVTMEHSSIVKFVEWNWLGQKTGQLGTRDTVVNNIGSMLDGTKTGIAVPE